MIGIKPHFNSFILPDMAGIPGTLSSAANAGVSASTSSLGGCNMAPPHGYHQSQLSHHQSYSTMHLPYVLPPPPSSSAAAAQQRHAILGAAPNRRSSSSSSDLLQTKLRKLLNTSDSKETITAELIMGHSTASNTPNTPGTFSYTSPKIHEQVN